MPGLGSLLSSPIRINIPAEFGDEASLLGYLGLNQGELKKIWFYRERMYQHFSIPKGNGGARMISAPDQRLKHLQRKLADKLSELYRPRAPVHGFVANRSVKSNALAHLHRQFVVNIDLKDFFPSIGENRIEGLVSSLGIHSRVAEIIARICCNNGHLPQGAPSSPVLSNMICFRLDKDLMKFAKKARCIYTRYADDITFSSHQPPSLLFEATPPSVGHFSPDTLSMDLRNAIYRNGFSLHSEKLHYSDRHSRRTVTGIKINDLLNVDRRYVRNIRAALHSVQTLGLTEAEKKFREQFSGNSSLAAHLLGKISFVTFIKGRTDPVVRGITVRFNALFPDNTIEVDPTQAEILERAVWVVDNTKGTVIEQGTAFFLKGVGLVTTAHTLEGADEFEIFHPSRHANKFRATIRKIDTHRDLAILDHNVPANEFFELELTQSPLNVGMDVTAIGYPHWGPGDTLNIRPGVVAALAMQHAIRLIEVTQKITQGMSGGPLLGTDQKVVGVNKKGGPGEGRDFAIHASVLEDWLTPEQPSGAD